MTRALVALAALAVLTGCGSNEPPPLLITEDEYQALADKGEVELYWAEVERACETLENSDADTEEEINIVIATGDAAGWDKANLWEDAAIGCPRYADNYRAVWTAREPEQDLAVETCKEALLEKLRAPSTTEWARVSVTRTAFGYRVHGKLDSQNGFGAMIRSDFECQAKKNSGGKFTPFDVRVG